MSDRSRLTSLLLASTFSVLRRVWRISVMASGHGAAPTHGSGGSKSGSGGGNIGTGGKVDTSGTGGRRRGGVGGRGHRRRRQRRHGRSAPAARGRHRRAGRHGRDAAPAGAVTGMGGAGVGGPAWAAAAWAAAASAARWGRVACVKPGPEYTTNNGSVTFYTLSQGSNGVVHCSYQVTGQNPDVIAHVPTGGGQYFAAMNTGDYNGAHTCGACVEVTRDGSRKVVATVVDECPIGSNNEVRARTHRSSQNAFLQIGTTAGGLPGHGQHPAAHARQRRLDLVALRSLPGDRQRLPRIKPGNQNEIFFENLITPIKSVSVNGQTSNTCCRRTTPGTSAAPTFPRAPASR